MAAHAHPFPSDDSVAKRARTEGAHEGHHFGTLAIHAGQPSDSVTGAVCVPISLASTFQQRTPGVAPFEYSRTLNPTRVAYQECVAALEGGKYGLAFASGCAATGTITNMLEAGDHIICSDDVYGGTQRYFLRVATKFGVKISMVDMTNVANISAALTPQTKMIWVESPTNPTLKLTDIRAAAEIAHAYNKDMIVVVDNTFMTPYFQKPLALGADIVVHSVTKYMNGHCDVVGGVTILNDQALWMRLKFLQNTMGAVPAPFDCYQVMRGIKTLHLRMERHASNALAVAQFLEAHPKIQRVIYPGLPSHPQHELACRQMSGFSGMITFFVKGGLLQARTLLESFKLAILAESLGGVETLIEHPALMTHASVPAETRATLGISDTLVRMSVGVEDIQDILADLAQALDAVPPV